MTFNIVLNRELLLFLRILTMQTTCRTHNIPILQVQKEIGLIKFSGFDPMNTKILLLLNVLLCLMLHTGCGTIHRHDAEKKLETLYATEVTFENRFRLQVFSDAQPGQEENIYNMNAGSRSVEFWHDFEQYQDKFGKRHALAQLEKMVRVNGLCMIMAYEGRGCPFCVYSFPI